MGQPALQRGCQRTHQQRLASGDVARGVRAGRGAARKTGEREARSDLIHFFLRGSVAFQFTSQVFPPSSEKACSKRIDSAERGEMTKRTRIARPSSVSWP